MKREEIADFVRSFEGWLFDGEARRLFELARCCNPSGVIVEIGSWKGRSTICLAKGSEEGPRAQVHAIDPHTGSEEHQGGSAGVWTFDTFKQNIQSAHVFDRVTPRVQSSLDAAASFSQPIGLLFIDGAHDYDSVKADLEAWFPKVIEGGIIAFHDTITWEGPKRVVRDQLFRSRRFRGVRFTNSITYGQKVAANTLLDRLTNRFWLLVKSLHDPLFTLALHPPVKRFLLRCLGRKPA